LFVNRVDILNQKQNVPMVFASMQKPLDHSGAGLIVPSASIKPACQLIKNQQAKAGLIVVIDRRAIASTN